MQQLFNPAKISSVAYMFEWFRCRYFDFKFSGMIRIGMKNTCGNFSLHKNDYKKVSYYTVATSQLAWR